MKKYGLIGKKLGHSWSKKWFDDMFQSQGIQAQYCLYELPSLQGLRQWVATENLSGFNVTIPYKVEILPLLDLIDPAAQSIGAVNCVEVTGGLLIGHNTDAPAFAQTLSPLLAPWHTRALILGTGGASKAVAHALRQLGIEHTLVSRTPLAHPHTIGYSLALHEAAETYLIVNCTPVGMYPRCDASPWPSTPHLGHKHLCYDLIYNPAQTLFLQQAQQCHAAIQGGLDMLHRQAQLSWEIWEQTRRVK
jgi:shikimate dehydrogenase